MLHSSVHSPRLSKVLLFLDSSQRSFREPLIGSLHISSSPCSLLPSSLSQVGLPPCGSQNEYGVGSRTSGLRQALFFQWLAASASWVPPRSWQELQKSTEWSWVDHSSDTHHPREGMNHPALFSVILQSLHDDTVLPQFAVPRH